MRPLNLLPWRRRRLKLISGALTGEFEGDRHTDTVEYIDKVILTQAIIIFAEILFFAFLMIKNLSL